MPYENSDHPLHRCYRAGWLAARKGEEDNPHAVGTNEWAWWGDGWSDGVCLMIRKKGEVKDLKPPCDTCEQEPICDYPLACNS